MRVLVTGASGFIGRHCVPYLLERGHEVHAVGRRALQIPGVTWHLVDLLTAGAPARLLSSVNPDAVLHLAWCTAPGAFWSSQDNLRWVEASMSLFHASSVSRCKRIIVAGTSAEYDWGFGVCSESSTPLRPANLYGTCKLSVYSILEKFAPLAGITWCWGRIFNVYGPYENRKRLVPAVIQAVLSPENPEIVVAAEKRDFLHVTDVARALVMMLESEVSGAVNIGSGTALAIRDIVEKVASLADRQPRILSSSVSSAAPRIQADNSVLRKEVGWRPQFDIEHGLAETIAWWRRHADADSN